MFNTNTNTATRDVITATASQVRDMYMQEYKRAQYCRLNNIGNKSNNNGIMRKCDFMMYLLDAVSDDVTFTIEGCWGDSNIRNFKLPNSGSVIEVIVKALLDKGASKHYTKQFDNMRADARVGCIDFEVKAVPDSQSKNTAPDGTRPVLLVNCAGVSVIAKDAIAECADARGRFKSNCVYGKRNHPTVVYLEAMLGIEGGYERVTD